MKKRLRKMFDTGIETRDAEMILDVLDKVYYMEEYNLFDRWCKKVTPLLEEIKREEEDFIRTAVYPAGFTLNYT